MRERLSPHPTTPCALIEHIEAALTRPDFDHLLVNFKLAGQLGDLWLPETVRSHRGADLWQRTCFEVFITFGENKYAEFNFSPSTVWAAYLFDDYRQGMKDALMVNPPVVEVTRSSHEFHMNIALPLSTILPDANRQQDWSEDAGKIALSAVIEENDGTMSYWALAHQTSKPDFHHRDGFVLSLPEKRET